MLNTKNQSPEKFRKDLEARTRPLVKYIGEFAVVFGEIEGTLDFALSEMISPYSHDYGKIFLKGIGFSKKKDLFKNLVDWRIRNDKLLKNKNTYRKKLDEAVYDLVHAGEIRNKILHAQWTWWDVKRSEMNFLEYLPMKYLKKYIDELWDINNIIQKFVHHELHIGMTGGPMPGIDSDS